MQNPLQKQEDSIKSAKRGTREILGGLTKFYGIHEVYSSFLEDISSLPEGNSSLLEGNSSLPEGNSAGVESIIARVIDETEQSVPIKGHSSLMSLTV